MSRASSRVKLSSKAAAKLQKRSTIDLEVKKYEVPQLAWRIVPESAMKKLVKDAEDIEKFGKKFAAVLSLTESDVSLKEAAQLDYFVAGFWHALTDWKMTIEQLSSFITILHMLLDNIKSKNFTLGENIKALQDLLCDVGVPNAPTPLECFTADLAASVLKYVQSSLFQHYALFQYLCTEEQEDEEVTTKLTVEVPNLEELQIYPAPLEESIPLTLYEDCLVTKTQSKQSLTTQVQSQEEDVDAGEATDDAIEAGSEVLDDELEVTREQLKALIEKYAASTLQSFQTEMLQKLKDKEDTIANKLSKLEKNLGSLHH